MISEIYIVTRWQSMNRRAHKVARHEIYSISSLSPSDTVWSHCNITDDILTEECGGIAQITGQWSGRAISYFFLIYPGCTDIFPYISIAWPTCTFRKCHINYHDEWLENNPGEDECVSSLFPSTLLTYGSGEEKARVPFWPPRLTSCSCKVPSTNQLSWRCQRTRQVPRHLCETRFRENHMSLQPLT